MQAHIIDRVVEDVKSYVRTGDHPWPPVEENNGYRAMTPQELYYFLSSVYRGNENAELHNYAMGKL